MNIIRLSEIDSTNLYAKSNLPNLPDKTIILADRQNKGRGRFDRAWIDLGNDNIFMSIVLKPTDTFINAYTNLTQYLSLAVCKVLENYNLNPKIKWPNDVLIGNKKICGILSETVTQGSNLKGIILGIGVNINSDTKGISQIKDKEATALNIELNIEHADKEKFTEQLIDEFFNNYQDFIINGFQSIKPEYISRTSFLNTNIRVNLLNKIAQGKAIAITDNGELILKNDDEELTLTIGDIL